MATHTKQPEVLRELFEALGSDPRVIAECLARPQVAERVLRSCYPFDQRIHGQRRQSAAAELLAHPRAEQMKLTSGIYSEIELIKSEESEERAAGWTEHSIKLKSSDWDETLTKLAAAFDNVSARRGSPDDATAEKDETIPAGEVSSLQEDETRYYAAAVTEAAHGRLSVATVTWSKEPVDAWRAKVATQLPDTMAAPIAAYTLPTISGQTDGCTPDTWASSSLNTPTQRVATTAIWTGTEVIVWGGTNGGSPPTPTNTGGRYNPSTDAWSSTSTINAPSARGGHTAVWTGSEMIVWGGGWLNSGARYNPTTDTWVATSVVNAPSGRTGHSGVWTGNEMIIWGGRDNAGEFNTGGRYNPSTDTWTATSNSNAPAGRNRYSTVWTGNEMIVWGGIVGGSFLNSGGRYNPAADTWTATTTNNAPAARFIHTAVWTGSKMIVWGGHASSFQGLDTGGQYDPVTDSWTPTATAGAPAGRDSHTAIWTGSRMVVWGGLAASFTNTGGRYDPVTNTWAANSTANAPEGRMNQAAVWTGNEMFVWFGENGLPVNTGGRYDPAADTWLGPRPPSVRLLHTAVWTGSEMIVWGGHNGYSYLNTGGKYNPATDTFVPATTAAAPSARGHHTAIWSGTEMIVWGGFGGTNATNSGGRYNPATDNWAATSTFFAPVGRSFHTAIWTGGQMIVWGGHDASGNQYNTGGKYNPDTDAWIGTSTINAATARSRHTAIWTGNEMVVWAGTPNIQFGQYINTGGRYNPETDSWRGMTTINAPSPRSVHTAVWTGNEMIVWGGSENSTFSSPYFKSGGRYNPNTDSWTATNESNAPGARAAHSAIWTGQEMIVWGGGSKDPPYWLNTGGRYDPSTDAWISVATTNNAPTTGYSGHTAVWTGSEMIVWGGASLWGYMNNGGRYCGEPAPVATPGLVANVSTRLQVGSDDDALFEGFIIQGPAGSTKKIIVRALGPFLAGFNVPDPLDNPTLDIFQGGTKVATNNNWRTTEIGGLITADQSNEIATGGFAPSDEKESAIIANLAPGSYTAVVRGLGNTTGIGLVDAFDLSAASPAKVVNFATRGLVQPGDKLLTAGFIIQNGPVRAVIRAIGPSLTGPPFNITNALPDTTLQLRDQNAAIVQENDDWQTDQKADLEATGLQPTNPKEAALVRTIPPGQYTAQVRGKPEQIGIGVVEIYFID